MAIPEEEAGSVEEVEETPTDVEDTDDGGAIVRMEEDDSPPPASDSNFYDNIVDQFEEADLAKLCEELLKKIDYDKESRKKRDTDYADAMKRTGLGDEAPGGAQFQGASKVVHPMLTEACVDFSSRAIAELLPPSGPVKDFIPGKPTKDRVEKAQRKSSYMNWQFKVQMPSFRSELEQLLTQLPLGGSQFLRLVWDSRKKKPIPVFIPIDDVYLPYAANDFFTAERITYVEHITQFEYDRRVDEGIYRDVGLAAPAQLPEVSKAEKANERVEGKSANPYNEDGLRDEYEVQTFLDIEDDYSQAPYLITIDPANHIILSITRNWEQEDDLKAPMFWTIPFGFVPWRGAYHIGLNQMMAGLPAATTGTLRALLDSAHINNLPSLMKLKGANFSGQSKEFTVASVTEIEGGIASDDIRKLIMAIPYNPPSTVLFSLLGFLVDAGKGVVRTTFDNLTDQKPDMPVGTVLAMIEQGMKVMSAIHLRLWNSMDHLIRVLHRINKMYVTDEEIEDDTGELLARRSDFQNPLDVVPTAEPEIFSDVQRFAQMQLVADRAKQLPQLYDLRKVELMILKRTKIPDAEDLLVPQQKPQWMNAVNENAAATLGRPIAAFPEQDHLGHIQVHVDFLKSPFFGQSPLIAPTFIPAILGHLKEHIALWYVEYTVKLITQAMGGKDIKEIMEHKDPKTRAELDKTLAAASETVIETGAKAFEGLPPIIQEAMKLAQQYTQPQMMDPGQAMLEKAKIDAQSRTEVAQLRSVDNDKKNQSTANVVQLKTSADLQRDAMKQSGEDQRSAEERLAEMSRTQFEEAAETARTDGTNESRERINTEDNITAMEISSAEIKSGEKVNLKNGNGINPE